VQKVGVGRGWVAERACLEGVRTEAEVESPGTRAWSMNGALSLSLMVQLREGEESVTREW
jgi:hypothetical protein